jgi:hypothetical protein
LKIERPTLSRGTDERRQFQRAARVSWRTRSGENKQAPTEIVDLSLQGACIRIKEPIELRTMVYLQAPGYGAIGNASVRYCVCSGLKYRIGLLFSAPTGLADSARQKYLDQRALQEGSRPAAA